jgi:DNA-binding Lrp family transcriptional regulator
MNKFERTCIKVRILKLVRMKSTGKPAELAAKFDISERSVKRIIREMKEEGNPITYDYLRSSYVIEENQ